jgi:hypothetical protein
MCMKYFNVWNKKILIGYNLYENIFILSLIFIFKVYFPIDLKFHVYLFVATFKW